MTSYNNIKPAAPKLTRAAAMRLQRNRFRGMTAAEMCRAMDPDELERNVKRGGEAAIAEAAHRIETYVAPTPDLDLGV